MRQSGEKPDLAPKKGRCQSIPKPKEYSTKSTQTPGAPLSEIPMIDIECLQQASRDPKSRYYLHPPFPHRPPVVLFSTPKNEPFKWYKSDR